jgi:hypothetical protein
MVEDSSIRPVTYRPKSLFLRDIQDVALLHRSREKAVTIFTIFLSINTFTSLRLHGCKEYLDASNDKDYNCVGQVSPKTIIGPS